MTGRAFWFVAVCTFLLAFQRSVLSVETSLIFFFPCRFFMSLTPMLRSIFSGYELIFLNTHLYKEEEGSTHGGCCLIFTLNLSYLQRSTFVFSPHCLHPPFLAPPRATEASLLPLSPPIQSAVPEPAYLWGADPISYHPDRRVQILEILREVSQDGLQRVLMARSTLWNQHFLLNRSRVRVVDADLRAPLGSPPVTGM